MTGIFGLNGYLYLVQGASKMVISTPFMVIIFIDIGIIIKIFAVKI